MASFNIVNKYTNIPLESTIDIIKLNLTNDSDLSTETGNELANVLKIVLEHNYFHFDNKYYEQKEVLTMESPLSNILSEIYFNHIEDTHILSSNNTFSKNIMLYKRYVNDTIIFYRGNTRQLTLLNNLLNEIAPNLQFTLETENNGHINFLYLKFKKKQWNDQILYILETNCN